MKLSLALAALIAAPLAGQSTVITEAGYSTLISGRTDKANSYDGPARFHLSAAVGVVKPVTSTIGLGGILSVGVWDDFYISVGPRVRLHTSEHIAVDVTPQLIITRGNGSAGRGMIDAAVMYKDQIGASVQVGSFQRYTYSGGFPDYTTSIENKAAVFAGFRLGRKPGRYGILADAVALAGAFGLFLILCANSGCD